MRRFTAAPADFDTGLALVTQSLAPAPSLLHARVRECRDMGPNPRFTRSGPLGHRGVSFRIRSGVGWLRLDSL